jgi:hypothetical protein
MSELPKNVKLKTHKLRHLTKCGPIEIKAKYDEEAMRQLKFLLKRCQLPVPAEEE